MVRNVKILVSGRVQGVFFRQSTKTKAKEYGVLGTVQNLEDGRVEIFAQAETAALEPFIAWCRKGPLAARVDHVEINESDNKTAQFTSFDII